MYILIKTSVGSAKKVRTFFGKSTDVLGEKYGRFLKKVRTFFGKSTDVLGEKYGRFFETFRCFCISLIIKYLQMREKRLKTV